MGRKHLDSINKNGKEMCEGHVDDDGVLTAVNVWVSDYCKVAMGFIARGVSKWTCREQL